jgi:hypothetical protein
MPDDLTELRAEVARLHAELKQVRHDLGQTMRLLGVFPPEKDEPWPRFLALEVESLILRNPKNERSIPIRIETNEQGARLRFDDAQYRTRGELNIDHTGVWLAIRNEAGNTVLSLGESAQAEPHVYVARPDGKPAVGMQVKADRGGLISVLDERNRALVIIGEEKAGGEVIVANRNGKSAVTFKATDRGSLLTVHEPSGQVMGFLSADTEQGTLATYGPHGTIAAVLMGAEQGGVLVLNDPEGNMRASVP